MKQHTPETEAMMAWLKMTVFDPILSPEIHGDRFLVAGTYPNGIKWVDMAYLNKRGWFSDHKEDAFQPEVWMPLPVYD